jgi:ATP phosphoribosyltransferase regulatory subunit
LSAASRSTNPPIRLPSGVRDFLPAAAARRIALASRLSRIFESWGYARIITPVFECADVLERGLGADARAAAIRFVEPGTGEVVALRPDITAQVARLVATRLAVHEAGSVRLSYEGAVYRRSGRLADELGQREILQAGIELIDLGAPEGDAEALAVAAAALGTAGVAETRLDVGHVAPLRHVLDGTPEAVRPAIITALGRKDRAALRVSVRELPAALQPLAEALVGLWGPAEPTLARALALPWPAAVRDALHELRAILAGFCELAGTTLDGMTIDLGDLRGFDYYTGVRFAGYVDGAPDAVLRGGRYDSLIGRYGRPARATGFAVDLELLAQAQRAAGVSADRAPLGIAVHGPGAASVARRLRSRGLRAVCCAAEPTPSWLSAAGLDRAIAGDDAAALAELLGGT